MNESQLVQTIDHRFRQNFKEFLFEGVVLSAAGGQAQVQIVGSLTAQPAIYDPNDKLEPGTGCLLVLLPQRRRYAILLTFVSTGTGAGNAGYDPDQRELSPPSNLTAHELLAGIAMASWYAPYQQSVLFEVQTSASGVEADAITVLQTRGSYALVDSDVPVYLRVRSISPTPRYSAWTDWLLCTPGSASGSGGSLLPIPSFGSSGKLSAGGAEITQSEPGSIFPVIPNSIGDTVVPANHTVLIPHLTEITGTIVLQAGSRIRIV